MTANGTSQQYGYEATLDLTFNDGCIAQVTIKATDFPTALRALYALGTPEQLQGFTEQAIAHEEAAGDE